MFKILALAVLICVAIANPVTFTDCGAKEVTGVEVAECTTNPCVLHKGKDVHLTVTFTANEDSATAVFSVNAILGTLSLPLPGVDSNACNGHLACPLKSGTSYKLNYTINVPAEAPTIEADIQARLVGDGSKVLGCGRIHGSIQP